MISTKSPVPTLPTAAVRKPGAAALSDSAAATPAQQSMTAVDTDPSTNGHLKAARKAKVDIIAKQREALRAVARDASLEVLAEMGRMNDASRLKAMSYVATAFRRAFLEEFTRVVAELMLNP